MKADDAEDAHGGVGGSAGGVVANPTSLCDESRRRTRGGNGGGLSADNDIVSPDTAFASTTLGQSVEVLVQRELRLPPIPGTDKTIFSIWAQDGAKLNLATSGSNPNGGSLVST